MKLFTAIPFLCFFVAANAQENVRESENEIRILSAYHGLDPLPPLATRLCGLPPARGQDGMPVAFSVQINSASVSAAAFAVETTSGEIVTPLCATLRPAIETLEQRTVLLIGPFSVGDSLPLSVEIVGQLEDVDGNSGNFYRARAQITENELKDTPPGFNIMPGMKVSGKFRVGKRKLITYFIYPLIRTLGNSFAEP